MEVSVVIPCYNKENYIENCIRSIQMQDFPSFEVLMIDDGSTDKTGDLCDNLAATDSRLSVFHTQNEGVTAARRYGVEHARGKYIIFVDSDDALMPNAIRLLYDKIEQSGADEVIGTHKTQDGKLYDSKWRGWQEPEKLVNDLLSLRNSFCVLWAVIFRKTLLDGCLNSPRAIISGEDILMQIKCLLKRNKVYFIGDVVYLYNKGLPNERQTDISHIRAFDQELEKTLRLRWDEFAYGFVLHAVKTYESFLYRRQFHVLPYYSRFRGNEWKKCLKKLPVTDYIAFNLPPKISWGLVYVYKKLYQFIYL
jgi:glycosyltransferase involved in cell wall biosynthesis